MARSESLASSMTPETSDIEESESEDQTFSSESLSDSDVELSR